jgi:hypothetical protein
MKYIPLAVLSLILSVGVNLSSADPSKPATQSSPEAVVADLYKQQDRKAGPFFQIKSRELIEKYFTAQLAQLIYKDASKKEDAHLDFDPLYDAQDFKIKDFAIHKTKSEETKAEVTASFDNIGVKTKIVYSLELTKAGWRIADVRYKDHPSLVALLSGK